MMKSNNLFNSSTLGILQNKQECANLFKHNSANGILYKVNKNNSEEEQDKQRNGVDGSSRYYPDRYYLDNDEYFVSSEWKPVTEEENPRKLFIDWIKSMLKDIKFETGIKSIYARNRIFFGAPGTGKSYLMNQDRMKMLGNDNETDYERVTFHPDYSYANFVGTYKPVPSKDKDGNETITYKYVPGPFMRVYVSALKDGRTDKPKPHLLIIEEINRANVAAVFGDIFQLLDRDDSFVSEYSIQASEDIRKYLAEELKISEEKVSKIKLPDNMFIWATMNSADQGVFPMDTAFKRRWDFRYIGIDENDEKICGKYVVVGSLNKQRIEWNSLRKSINKFLADEKINEDKQLGPYFIAQNIVFPEEGDEIDRKRFCDAFKNKVLMYLYDDAAKQKRSKLFEGFPNERSRYSEVCKDFDEIGIGIFNPDIQLRVEVNDLVTKNHELDANGMIKRKEEDESGEGA